jgi:hypothetical protein
MFFSWLKHFSSEFFSRILLVMQTFLSFILSNRATNFDATPVVLVIDRYPPPPRPSSPSHSLSLFSCNQEASIVPASLFCNPSVPQAIDLFGEWSKFKTSDVSKIFNFFSYQFLFPVEAKDRVVRWEFRNQMNLQSNRHINKYLFAPQPRPLPRGAVVKSDPNNPTMVTMTLQLRVRRNELLASLEESIRGIIEDDISTLLLPLTYVPLRSSLPHL